MTVTREACIVFCILWSVSLNFWSLMYSRHHWQRTGNENSCLWDKTRGDKNFIYTTYRKKDIKNDKSTYEALPGGVSHVARLNFKTSRVGVYKRLSLIVGFATTVAICWRRMSLVAISFYALSLLFGPCRLSEFTLAGPHLCKVQAT